LRGVAVGGDEDAGRADGEAVAADHDRLSVLDRSGTAALPHLRAEAEGGPLEAHGVPVRIDLSHRLALQVAPDAEPIDQLEDVRHVVAGPRRRSHLRAVAEDPTAATGRSVPGVLRFQED